jgi:hypothetical protein
MPMLIFSVSTLVSADVFDFSFFSAYNFVNLFFLIAVFSAEICRELLEQELRFVSFARKLRIIRLF